jgi:hypothetical protein
MDVCPNCGTYYYGYYDYRGNYCARCPSCGYTQSVLGNLIAVPIAKLIKLGEVLGELIGKLLAAIIRAPFILVGEIFAALFGLIKAIATSLASAAPRVREAKRSTVSGCADFGRACSRGVKGTVNFVVYTSPHVLRFSQKVGRVVWAGVKALFIAMAIALGLLVGTILSVRDDFRRENASPHLVVKLLFICFSLFIIGAGIIVVYQWIFP